MATQEGRKYIPRNSENLNLLFGRRNNNTFDAYNKPFPCRKISDSTTNSDTYLNRSCDWLIMTIKDNKTTEVIFLKNES